MNERTTPGILDGDSMVMPVLREELEIRKQKVQTGVVDILKLVHERQEVVDEPLTADKVDVSRLSIGRAIDAPIPVRQEGDTTIISIMEERLVVTKQLFLKEEVRITRRSSEIHDPLSVTLRSEELIVDRIPAQDRLPVDPKVSDALFVAFQEGRMELLETVDETVVSKAARVVEEVILSKETTQRQETIKDTVRHTEVNIEDLSKTGGAASHAAADYQSASTSRNKKV